MDLERIWRDICPALWTFEEAMEAGLIPEGGCDDQETVCEAADGAARLDPERGQCLGDAARGGTTERNPFCRGENAR